MNYVLDYWFNFWVSDIRILFLWISSVISNSLVSRDSLHHKTGEIHLETSKMREKQRKKTRKTEKKSFSTRSRARAAVKGRERRSVWTRVDPRLFEERISTPSSSPLSHAFRSLKSGRNPLGTTRNAQKPRWLKKEQKTLASVRASSSR